MSKLEEYVQIYETIPYRNIDVMDKMVNLLEKHSKHLEELVQERTQELGDEKKKVENLLHSILPKFVLFKVQ